MNGASECENVSGITRKDARKKKAKKKKRSVGRRVRERRGKKEKERDHRRTKRVVYERDAMYVRNKVLL